MGLVPVGVFSFEKSYNRSFPDTQFRVLSRKKSLLDKVASYSVDSICTLLEARWPHG